MKLGCEEPSSSVEIGEQLRIDKLEATTLDAFDCDANCVEFTKSGLVASGSDEGSIKIWESTTLERLHVMEGHRGSVFSIAINHTQTVLASSSFDRTVKLWSMSTGRCIKTLKGHGSIVWDVAFSPSESTIASASADGTVKLWDAAVGNCIKTLSGHDDGRWVNGVAFSPDGDRLASCSRDATVRVWDVASGECTGVLGDHSCTVICVAFSAAGTIASGDCGGVIKLWDGHQCTHTIRCCDVAVRCLAFSPDCGLLVSGSADAAVRIWRLEPEPKSVRDLPGHSDRVYGVAFTADGAGLGSASRDGSIRIWRSRVPVEGGETSGSTSDADTTVDDHESIADVDPATPFESDDAEPPGAVLESEPDLPPSVDTEGPGTPETQCPVNEESFVLDPCDPRDGAMAQDELEAADKATGPVNETEQEQGADDTLDLDLDVGPSSNGEGTTRPRQPSMAVSVVGSTDGQPTSSCLHVINTPSPEAIALFPDGTMVSGHSNYFVRMWDKDWACRRAIGHGSVVNAVAVSPDGQLIASGGDVYNGKRNSPIKLWDAATGQLVRVFEGTGNVSSLAFSPDGKALVSGSQDYTVRRWDVQRGKCVKTMKKHTHFVKTVAFSPDGKTIASGSSDYTIRVWNSQSGKQLKVITDHGEAVTSVVFSPDGALLASGSDDGSIRLWDTKKWRSGVKLRHDNWHVHCVAFSPNGKMIACGTYVDGLKLWDTASGELLKWIKGHEPPVIDVAFTVDGEGVISVCGGDNTIKLWDVGEFVDGKT
ncbi:WD domain G-beta repeat [Carpediemonas membranifera]|uniref:WD domain G-beta repeat n=1 Tax=Carpediemonas membranifera TaxID=201153 RepID=A0A8J6E3J0_9EUKA|nr:WD domain G-beta repeat [Carpediemonas membranifera]|eukprot:KAG9393247.1 WD domain G-beta repeat [Carpediemonas membranifera]